MKTWEAHKSQERGIYEVHEKGGNGRICSITNRSGEEKVAKLIAAAPELLAALKEEVANKECLWRWDDKYWQTSCGNRTIDFGGTTCPYCKKILVQTQTIHPAIAKATT